MNLRRRVPPPLWALLCAGLMWLLDRLAPLATVIQAPATRAGWGLVAFGAAIIVTAMLQFRAARTTVNPLAAAKASALVQSGIFGYSRNPMYLGLALALAGWGVVLGSASPWLGVPLFVLVITRLQIEPEEAVLTQLFGTAFTDYCARVGRWFGHNR